MHLDAYIRVSRVAGRAGDSFISPNDQLDRIKAWAKLHRHEIIERPPELDVSGGTTDRPILNEVMRRIEAGETDGVVVAKLDRLGRTLIDTLRILKRIQEKGALFASVADQFDISTANGRFMLNVMLSMAQFELERIGDSWDAARVRAVDRGLYIGPTAPFGYRIVRDENGKEPRLEVDPETGPIITELFERRAAGQGWVSLAKWMQGADPEHKPWPMGSMQRTLKRRAYLGIAHHGEYERPGAHDALTDPATFAAVQARRMPRNALKYGDKHLLRGLVRCASCRYTMQLASTGGGRRPNAEREKGPVYRCYRNIHTGDCPSATTVSVNGGPRSFGLDDYVVERLFEERLPKTTIEAEPFGADSEIEELEKSLETAKTDLAVFLSDSEILEAAGREAFMVGVDARRSTVDAAQAELDEALRSAGHRGPPRTLREDWESMTIPEKREALSQEIQAVFVRSTNHPEMDRYRRRNGGDGIQGASARRIHIVWVDDPPVDVPRQGRRGYVIQPFPFPDDAD